MVKAVFLDFYGTLVQEDDEAIHIISKRIMETGNAEKLSDIGAYWWSSFQKLFVDSYGDTFEAQRKLEEKSLKATIEHFGSTENADELSRFMFTYWVRPAAFEESQEFLERCPVPVYIVSNIDRADIEEAICYHRFAPEKIFTSEDARAYKPRKELFELALQEAGLTSKEVVHIGDSLGSDIQGAGALGIKTIWINRKNKKVPEGVLAVSNLLEIFKTRHFSDGTCGG